VCHDFAMTLQFCLWLTGLSLAAESLAAAEPTPRVLVIGIDGCRPDALERANAPHLDGLIAGGAYFAGTDIREPEATDGADTVSGPGWSNLLTGVWPDKHGVMDNKFTAPRYEQYPHVFVRLKSAKPQAVTASFTTWAPIADLITRDADHSADFSPDDKDYARADAEATAACLDYLKAHDPDLLFFYQGQVDETGHQHGFHPNVPEYIAAIERVDAHVGRLLATTRERPAFANEDWLTIVCTDHGGIGLRHGDGHNDPDVRTTFLIVSGPAALCGKFDAPTYQVDVVATALTHLRVTPREEWGLDGKPVGLKSPPAEIRENRLEAAP
jgi:predicted AlkP superfamily pyrophosphatase or phosphodiesterase